jgi:copper homeostasis protein
MTSDQQVPTHKGSDAQPMSNRFVLEICVDSVDHAEAAERSGAQRIELCSDLSSGGITPSAGLMQTARRHVKVPIHILIRPRAGDFCYSDREFETMRDDIRAAKQVGMDGLVLGILHENTRVDVERTKMLVEFAHPLPVTFHRAFDLAKNATAALEEVIQTGASRILTSGGEPRATDALLILTHLVQAAKNRILIMPCGGINSANILRIVRATSAREIHSSVGISRLRSTSNGNGLSHSKGAGRASFQSVLFEKKVVKLVHRLNGISKDN